MRDVSSVLLRLVIALLLLGSLAPTCRAADGDDKKSDDYYELMRTFADTFEQIERNYVTDINKRQLLEAAINGMLSELDPYSSYISPEDLAQFNQSVDQEFGGIGIQVQIDAQSKRLTVISPLPGTPAYKAGIKSGDTIMEIEGQSTEGFSINDAVRLLKGPAGDEVSIGVQHAGENKTIQMKIVREIIQLATVLGDRYKTDDHWDFMIDSSSKIGYIRLTHFSKRSSDELTEALKELQEAGMKGLILDLRFNPGGLLSQATEISDMFIDSGKIVSTKGKNTPERTWTAKTPGTYRGFPMAVLVNRYSASASEIVSACLQDHQRAVVIGERTWGKGSVQNVIELEGGSSALKLTTASYHRPSGKNIHKHPGDKDSDEWGVSPDGGFDIKFTSDELSKYLEYRRDRDVLSKNGPPQSEFKDRQLAKAMEYLQEKLGVAKAAPEKPAEPAKNTGAALPNAEKPSSGSKESAENRSFRIRIPHRAAA